MTMLVRESFNDWTSSTGEVSQINGSVVITAGQGRRGGAGLIIGSLNSGAGWTISAVSEVFTSFAFKPTALAGGETLLQLRSGSTYQVAIGVNSAGAVIAYRGGVNGTLLGSSASGLVTEGVEASFQVRVVISDTVGVVEVRMNGSGTPVLNLTSVDTKNGTPATVDTVWLGTPGTIAPLRAVTGYYSDFAVWDTTGSIANTWLGDVRVDSYFPNANGGSSQFTGSDGNSTDNYLLVDAAAPNGTDYVQSSTVSHKDLYGVQDMSHTPTSIFDVAVCGSVLKTDAGSRDIRLLAKSVATEVEGSTFSLSTSRERKVSGFETDPNTSAAWTKSGFDAMQIGQKVQA